MADRGLTRSCLPCVVFALQREAAPFLRLFPVQKRIKNAPCWTALCGDASCLVMQTGIGAARMRTALHWLFNSVSHPGSITLGGFAGGLHAEMNVASVLVAREVVDAEGNTWPVPIAPDIEGTTSGRLLTTARLIGDPHEKQALAHRHGAVAVDMETAAFADACTRRSIPFACVRAISDDVHTALSPRLVSLLSGERINWWRLLTTIVSEPSVIGEFLRLAKHTRVAADRLAATLHRLLQPTPVSVASRK